MLTSNDVIISLHVEEEKKKRTTTVGDGGLNNATVYQRNDSIHRMEKVFTPILE